MKLNPKCYGPFRVIKEVSLVVYQLQLPPSWNIHPMFHASLLSPYRKTPSHGPNFSWPPPNLINGEEEYEVKTPLIPHWVEGIPQKWQHMGKHQWHPHPKHHKRVPQMPAPPKDKRTTPLPPPFITIPSPFSLHHHPDPITVPLPLSPLLAKPMLPIDYVPLTEFFWSLFHLHLWSTNKFP